MNAQISRLGHLKPSNSNLNPDPQRLLLEKDRQIISLGTQLQAQSAKTSQTHTRLLGALDALDAIQSVNPGSSSSNNRDFAKVTAAARRYAEELDSERAARRNVEAKLQLYLDYTREGDAEREDLRDAVGALITKVEIERDFSVWPAAHMQITELLEPMSHLPAPLSTSATLDQLPSAQSYASTLLRTLTATLAMERKAHERTQRTSESEIAHLRAKLARRETELEGAVVHGIVPPARRTDADEEPDSTDRDRDRMRRGMSHGEARAKGKKPENRDEGEEVKEREYLTPGEILDVLERTTARNRTLEAEVRVLTGKLERAKSEHFEPQAQPQPQLAPQLPLQPVTQVPAETQTLARSFPASSRPHPHPHQPPPSINSGAGVSELPALSDKSISFLSQSTGNLPPSAPVPPPDPAYHFTPRPDSNNQQRQPPSRLHHSHSHPTPHPNSHVLPQLNPQPALAHLDHEITHLTTDVVRLRAEKENLQRLVSQAQAPNSFTAQDQVWEAMAPDFERTLLIEEECIRLKRSEKNAREELAQTRLALADALKALREKNDELTKVMDHQCRARNWAGTPPVSNVRDHLLAPRPQQPPLLTRSAGPSNITQPLLPPLPLRRTEPQHFSSQLHPSPHSHPAYPFNTSRNFPASAFSPVSVQTIPTVPNTPTTLGDEVDDAYGYEFEYGGRAMVNSYGYTPTTTTPDSVDYNLNSVHDTPTPLGRSTTVTDPADDSPMEMSTPFLSASMLLHSTPPGAEPGFALTATRTDFLALNSNSVTARPNHANERSATFDWTMQGALSTPPPQDREETELGGAAATAGPGAGDETITPTRTGSRIELTYLDADEQPGQSQLQTVLEAPVGNAGASLTPSTPSPLPIRPHLAPPPSTAHTQPFHFQPQPLSRFSSITPTAVPSTANIDASLHTETTSQLDTFFSPANTSSGVVHPRVFFNPPTLTFPPLPSVPNRALSASAPASTRVRSVTASTSSSRGTRTPDLTRGRSASVSARTDTNTGTQFGLISSRTLALGNLLPRPASQPQPRIAPPIETDVFASSRPDADARAQRVRNLEHALALARADMHANDAERVELRGQIEEIRELLVSGSRAGSAAGNEW